MFAVGIVGASVVVGAIVGAYVSVVGAWGPSASVMRVGA